MQWRKVSCKHRLVVGERRKNNSEGSFLYLFNLVAKVHWEVVVPHFTCVLKNRRMLVPLGRVLLASATDCRVIFRLD